MSEQEKPLAGGLRLRLPATSANLGPGFDAVAVALDFYLELEASAAQRVLDCRHGQRCGALRAPRRQSDSGDLQGDPGGERSADCSAGDQDAQRDSAGDGLRLVGGGTAGCDCAGRPLWPARLEHASAFSTRPTCLRGTRTTWRPAGWAALWPRPAMGTMVHVAQGDASGGVAGHCGASRRPAAHQQGARRAAGQLPAERCGCEYPVCRDAGTCVCAGPGRPAGTAMSDRIHQPYRAPICPLLPLLLPLVGRARDSGRGTERGGAGGACDCRRRRESRAGLSRRSGALLAARKRRSLLVCRFVESGASQTLEYNAGEAEIARCLK